jgi:hypothetical protein
MTSIADALAQGIRPMRPTTTVTATITFINQ